MLCFCNKLVNRNYDSINEAETALLRRTLHEARQLFQPLSCNSSNIEHDRTQDTLKRKKNDARSGTEQTRRYQPGAPPSSTPDLLTPLPAFPDAELPTFNRLIKTYIVNDPAPTLSLHPTPGAQKHLGAVVQLFVAIEQVGQDITFHSALRRIYCLAFAKLHKPYTSVECIAKEIRDALPDVKYVKDKVTQVLHVGKRWLDIIQRFAAIVNADAKQLTGLLGLLSSTSVWERAKLDTCTSVLAQLHATTAIHTRAIELTPGVNSFLDRINLERSFVDETQRFTSNPMSMGNRRALNRVPQHRFQHTLHGLQPSSYTQAIENISFSVPGLSDVGNTDVHAMVALLSFFPTGKKVPLALFLRGATPRTRWTVDGDTQELDAFGSGLWAKLQSLLSDSQRVHDAILTLESLSLISKFDQTCSLSGQAAQIVMEALPIESAKIWQSQALVVAYRAIPWKNLELPVPDTKAFLPPLRHLVEAFEDDFESLSTDTRVDLALTLLEASRFSNLEWKRFAVRQSERVARSLNHGYLDLCIAQSQCLVARLAGEIDQNFEAVQSQNFDRRMHSAAGLENIQISLNYMQIEAMSKAQAVLERWTPIDPPSRMEDVVLVRKHMLLGRVLRFTGKFDEALANLNKARRLTDDLGVGLFNEDLRDLICDLSDTLRELDHPVTAEIHLRNELKRREQGCSPATGQSSIQLSLAEALFAQTRLKEAAALCYDVQSRVGLKFERLRLHIILAKIHHVESKFEEALRYWSDAMRTIGEFPRTNGFMTRVIILSTVDVLSHLEKTDAISHSLKMLEDLDSLADPQCVQHWIAGTQHWLRFLPAPRCCL